LSGTHIDTIHKAGRIDQRGIIYSEKIIQKTLTLSGVSNLIRDETGEERISVLRPVKPASKNSEEFFSSSWF
jgi:hypothetical protein